MAVKNLKEILVHEVKDAYYMEKRLVAALQELADEAHDDDYRQAFKDHQKETKGHVKRLEQVFEILGESPEGVTCPGIEGLIKERAKFSKEEKPSPEILDYYTLGAAQKVERYEITAYENMIEMADKLSLDDAAELFQATLDEEESAVEKLKGFASEFDVSTIASEAGAEEEAKSQEGKGGSERRSERAAPRRTGRPGRSDARRS